MLFHGITEHLYVVYSYIEATLATIKKKACRLTAAFLWQQWLGERATV